MTVAVDPGRTGTRVAGPGPDGRPVLLGVLPAGTPAATAATVFAPGERFALARPGPGIVVDVGLVRTRLVRDGLTVHEIPVGGRDLDAAVAALLPSQACRPTDVTALREALSLQPAGTIGVTGGRVRVPAEEVRRALRPLLARIVDELSGCAGTEILLVGGVARTPLLAELADAAGLRVRVAEQPETAVVRAAVSGVCRGSPEPGEVAARPAPGPGALPLPPGPRVGRRRAALVVAGTVAVAALLGLGRLLPVPLPGTLLAQYGYELALPDGWEHAGGDPARRRTLLVPEAAPDGTGLIAVERTPLGYDAGTEPARAVAELRERHAGAAAAGQRLGVLRDEGGQLRFREEQAGAVVEWYVRMTGTDQLSVGCRAPPGGSAEVDRACAVVLASVRIG